MPCPTVSVIQHKNHGVDAQVAKMTSAIHKKKIIIRLRETARSEIMPTHALYHTYSQVKGDKAC